MKNFKEMVYGNLFEAKMAKKDYDGDGKIETSTEEYLGSRDKAIKKATGKLEEEEKKPSLEEEVKTILDEEGGAADLKKIKEILRDKNMEVPMDLEEKLKDMKNVMKHIKGDYIEMSGLKEENPDLMLPAE
tara:strand:+ start:537 stop:929 length:393 start_codon:yes stop_codon:yes gene_type:complete